MNHASGETACIRITVLLLLANAALGTDVTWTGAVSSDWNNAVNWNPSQVPTASDHVTINSGVVAVLGDATFAVMDWSGGTISGALTVASNGVLNLHGGGCTVLDLAASLTNAGTLTFGGGVALRLNGSSQVGQVVNLPGAVIDVRQDDDSPCWYLFPGGGLIDNRGLFRKSAGTGTASLASPFRNSGTVEAQTGTIYFFYYNSTGSSANLAISLGGRSPGSDYGQIHFSSPLALSATFSVSTRNGYVPNPGDRFQVLSYPSATGTFSCFNGLDLGEGILLQPQFTDTGLSLVATTYATNSSRPQLFISSVPGGVFLSWPLGYPDWALQAATNLVSAIWTPVPPQCANQAFMPTNAPRQFFRLAHGN